VAVLFALAGLVRRTILLLGTMLVMLVVAGGVVLAATYCGDATGMTCNCQGGLCWGTPDEDRIFDTDSYDQIHADAKDDGVIGGGDYIDGGPGKDYISGDGVGKSGNDILLGGDGDDDIYGDRGSDDKCYGGCGQLRTHERGRDCALFM